MEKLVYNSFTKQLGLLDNDTGLFRDLYTNKVRSVTENDEFHEIENTDDDVLSKFGKRTNSESEVNLNVISLIKSVRMHFILIISIIFVFSMIYINVDNDPPGEYPVNVCTDTLPATPEDIESFIEEFEVTNNIKLTEWRKNVIMGCALDVKKSRAHFIVDSIANEQGIKYRLK